MKFGFLISLLSLGALHAAGNLTVARPESAGVSSARLVRITAAMNADVQAGSIPGGLGLVARGGKVVYLETAGLADREKNIPLRPDTIFRIYSMSKPITAVGLMMLYEEGKFSLKDPVAKYIPQMAGLQVLEEEAPGKQAVKANREATIQDLLRHTAGLSYGVFTRSAVDTMYNEIKPLSATSMDDFIARLAKIPLRFQPGTRWNYSVAADVQGKLIEAISGMRFDQYLTSRIFKPLGMTDTGFFVPKAKQGRFAQMYTGGKSLTLANPESSASFLNEDLLFFSGGAGLVSTASDYLRFCQMLLNGGEGNGARILGRKTIELMTMDHLGSIPGRQDSGYGFGLGVSVHLNPTRSGSAASVGEYNWSGLAGTKFWIDPKEKLIGIYLIQVLPPRTPDPGDTFKQLVYQSIVD